MSPLKSKYYFEFDLFIKQFLERTNKMQMSFDSVSPEFNKDLSLLFKGKVHNILLPRVESIRNTWHTSAVNKEDPEEIIKEKQKLKRKK